MKQELLPLAHDVTLLRLGARNAGTTLRDLRDLLVHCDSSYPGIENWFSRRVVRDLSDDSRRVYLVYKGDAPIASAIAKKGSSVKLCNLRIGREWQEHRLGTLLISLVALSLAEGAESMHFTVPESVWKVTGSFFRGFGFELRGLADRQYRLWDNELACEARMTNLLGAVRRKLPPVLASYCMNGISTQNSLVLSVRPRYASAILNGQKSVEIRRQFSTKWQGSKALIYATAPASRLVGECLIDEVVTGSPMDIWKRYQDRIGCVRSEYEEYSSHRTLVSALLLKDVRQFREPLQRSRMEHILGAALKPPQSFASLTEESNWSAAASLGTLLQI